MIDESPVFVESGGESYKVARLPDFIKFRDFALAEDSAWTTAYKKEGIKVESRPPVLQPGEKPSGLNIVRVNVDMPEVDPGQLYDSLHDPDYRKSWDTNMLAGYNIVELDERNDIGYYAAKFPTMITNRDFCNQRSWMEFTNGEFLIMNHSEPHRDCPEKKGFIRARSIMTGYYIRLRDAGGVSLVYISQTDLKGSLPHWVLNSGLTKMAPNVMKNLEKCALNYPKWVEENRDAGFVGKWRTPQVAWDGSTEVAAKAAAVGAVPSADAVDVVGPGGSLEGRDDDVEIGGGTSSNLSAPERKPSAPGGSGTVLLSSEQSLQLQVQMEELKKQLFVANQRSGSAAGGGGGPLLAPVAPARPEDSVAIQQYRALMNDAVNFIDRQYIQEGRIPTIREYLTRLQCVVDGMQRTIPTAHK